MEAATANRAKAATPPATLAPVWPRARAALSAHWAHKPEPAMAGAPHWLQNAVRTSAWQAGQSGAPATRASPHVGHGGVRTAAPQ